MNKKIIGILVITLMIVSGFGSAINANVIRNLSDELTEEFSAVSTDPNGNQIQYKFN